MRQNSTGNDLSVIRRKELEEKVKDMYSDVASNPQGNYHFEIGRRLAEKLGYPSVDLDRVPVEAIESFAGVGFFFDIVNLQEGETVLDLGSGSGTDTFLSAIKTGRNGKVTGLDMTEEQLEKAARLAEREKFESIIFLKGYIENLPFEEKSFDVVISNGVVNLSSEKEKVFKEISRVLKTGGRLAVSDIVCEKELSEQIVGDASLWASCLGGASREDYYRSAIEKAGLHIQFMRSNGTYHFISRPAITASRKFGVKSITILASKSRNRKQIALT